MVIKISKKSQAKEIADALQKLEHSKDEKKLSAFYGKLKGVFGDALEYQKKVRNGLD